MGLVHVDYLFNTIHIPLSLYMTIWYQMLGSAMSRVRVLSFAFISPICICAQNVFWIVCTLGASQIDLSLHVRASGGHMWKGVLKIMIYIVSPLPISLYFLVRWVLTWYQMNVIHTNQRHNDHIYFSPLNINGPRVRHTRENVLRVQIPHRKKGSS